MKQKVLSLFLCICAAVMMPVKALAEGTISLSEDLTVYETIDILSDVEYDLNGHTVTLAEGMAGSVFHVAAGATLTITDSAGGGKITGGNAVSGHYRYDGEEGFGYGMYDGGTCGGGVYVENGATLILNGGTITENRAEQGGGVFLEPGAVLKVSGEAGITGNCRGAEGDTADNVWLPLDAVIELDGELVEAAEIGITTAAYVEEDEDKVTVTNGLLNKSQAAHFTSDEGHYVFMYDNEAVIMEEPEAIEGLLENGEEQELVTAGSASNGTMVYAIGGETAPAADEFSEDIPKASEAGTYHVWYMAVGNMNYADSETAYVDAVIEEVFPRFVSYSVSLSGRIGMNFYMDIPAKYRNENSKMEFIVTDANGNTRTQEVVYSDEFSTENGYQFTCYVNSIEMADDIQAVFHYLSGDTDQTLEKNTSIEAYLNLLTGSDLYSSVHRLAKALNNYGWYAQKSLSGGPDHTAMATLYEELPLPEEKPDQYPVKFTANDQITGAQYSLSLDSETMINFYLKSAGTLTEEEIEVRRGSETVPFSLKMAGSWNVVEVPGIAAHLLGETYKVYVSDVEVVSASALSYVQAVWGNDRIAEEAQQTARALYGYYLEAMAYKSN